MSDAEAASVREVDVGLPQCVQFTAIVVSRHIVILRILSRGMGWIGWFAVLQRAAGHGAVCPLPVLVKMQGFRVHAVQFVPVTLCSSNKYRVGDALTLLSRSKKQLCSECNREK